MGDEAFLCHSSCKEPGIVGQVKVVETDKPDDTAWDSRHAGYDPKSTKRQQQMGYGASRVCKRIPSPIDLARIENTWPLPTRKLPIWFYSSGVD